MSLIVFIFADLFGVRLTGRQLDSVSASVLQSVATGVFEVYKKQ